MSLLVGPSFSSCPNRGFQTQLDPPLAPPTALAVQLDLQYMLYNVYFLLHAIIDHVISMMLLKTVSYMLCKILSLAKSCFPKQSHLGLS